MGDGREQRPAPRSIKRRRKEALLQLVGCEPFADLLLPVDPANLFPG